MDALSHWGRKSAKTVVTAVAKMVFTYHGTKSVSKTKIYTKVIFHSLFNQIAQCNHVYFGIKIYVFNLLNVFVLLLCSYCWDSYH